MGERKNGLRAGRKPDIIHDMKLTAQVKLQPTPEQFNLLKRTLVRANEACDWISQRGFEEETLSQFKLHKLVYYDVRERFDLSAQMAVRAIAKVADAYKVGNKDTVRTFSRLGAFPYDNRLLSWKLDEQTVSIWTLDGREHMPFLVGNRALELLQGKRGEADLCFVRGEFYLFVACEVETPEPIDIDGALGIDRGLRNIAVDSDGERHSGAHMLSLRERRHRQRRRLQSKGTKSAKRLLRHLSGKEKRMVRDINHQVSKQIVDKAQRTNRAIVLEDLSGIRGRARAGRQQRRKLHNWPFYQLRQFVEYKAKLAGVPVAYVDPAYTSQTCSECGHASRSNRKSRDDFHCVSCGFSAPADHNAAINIAGLHVNQPHAVSD